MGEAATKPTTLVSEEADQMHALYRRGGLERLMAPHIVYPDADCPHPGCGPHLQAIDFGLADYGHAVHDPLVLAWWKDTGFVGRCPHCDRWIHFTIRAKRAVTVEDAAHYPQLPDDWHVNATIL